MANLDIYRNDIWQYSTYIWNTLFQLEEIRNDMAWYPLIPTLCIVIEKSLKWAVLNAEEEINNGEVNCNTIFKYSFKKIIKEALKKEIINSNDAIFLNNLKDIRNNLFHDFDPANFLEIDWKLFPLTENDTHIKIYDDCIEIASRIILKTLKN